MIKNPEEVLHDLKNKQFAPVYFLQGDEPYYIDLIAEYIEEHLLANQEKAFNQIVIYGKDHDVKDIINQAKQFPMMSDKRLVLVKELQEMGTFKNKEGQDLLQKYIENPLSSTVLVLCHKHKRIAKSKAIYKALSKSAIIVDSAKVYDNKIPNWIENYIRAKKHQISPQACYLLAESVGANLNRLATEIDKILINFNSETTIDEQAISKYVGVSKEYNGFELQNALGKKDIQKIYKIVSYLDSNAKNNPIIPIVALLYQFFSRLLIVHEHKNKTSQELAVLISVHPFFVKDYLSACQYYPLHKILPIIHYIKTADAQLKGVQNSGSSDGEVLKELVYRILH